MLKQKTLKDSFSLSGKGLHTGLDLTVTFNPAPDNHGYKIQRIDVEGQPIIDAVADNVTICESQIEPNAALLLKRRIDKSNQDRTDLVELIDSYFLDKYKDVKTDGGACYP